MNFAAALRVSVVLLATSHFRYTHVASSSTIVSVLPDIDPVSAPLPVDGVSVTAEPVCDQVPTPEGDSVVVTPLRVCRTLMVSVKLPPAAIVNDEPVISSLSAPICAITYGSDDPLMVWSEYTPSMPACGSLGLLQPPTSRASASSGERVQGAWVFPPAKP